MEKIGTIITIILYALALAIGILGAIFFYLEMEFFGTNTALLLLFIAVFFLAIAGLNSADRDWIILINLIFFIINIIIKYFGFSQTFYTSLYNTFIIQLP